MLPLNQVLLGDCLEVMRSLPDGCVDALISDPPYGTTNLAFDKTPVDLGAFWKEAHRVCKINAAMVLFSAQPFTTDLIVSNRKNYSYDIIWQKTCPVGFFGANKRPLKAHENILIFSQKQTTYNPQKTLGKPYNHCPRKSASHYGSGTYSVTTNESGERFPLSVQRFSNPNYKSLHPTQKPLDLMQWLTRTYTNPGDLILDPYAGSASTCHAALLEGRNYIGIERDPGYHAIAVERIAGARAVVG